MHDIVDNRDSYLADAVRPLLSQSARAHFAVGYFFLSGFKAIASELEKVQELRLLIGNTTDRATVEQLAEGHASREAILADQSEGEFLNAQQRAKLVIPALATGNTWHPLSPFCVDLYPPV